MNTETNAPGIPRGGTPSYLNQLFDARFSRRRLLQGAAAAAAGTSLISSLEAVAARAGVARSQILVALPTTPTGWDGDQDFGPITEDMINAIHGRLVDWKNVPYHGGLLSAASSIDYRPNLVPSLATNYSIKGQTVTFELRQGQMSHAGNELTSADVQWTYERAFGLKGVGFFLNTVGGLKSMQDVKVLGKYAISFSLAQPVDIFLMSAPLSHRQIFDSTVMKQHASTSDPWAAKWAPTGDAGFGKWKVGTYEPGNEMIIEAFAGAVGGPPAIPQIVLKEVPSDSDRTALLSRGAVDAAYLLTPREYKALGTTKGVTVWNFPSIDVALFQLDPNFPPLDKVEVRQALAYATPYDAIVNDVFLGFAKRAGGPIPSAFPGYKTSFSDKYQTDLSKAKTLLQQAGASNFSTTIGYNSDVPVQQQMAILFQSNLSQIGVKASLQGMPSAAYNTEQTSTKTSAKVPIMAYIDGPFVPHPYYGLFLNFDTHSVPNNWSQVVVPGLDALLAKMIKTPSFSEVVAQAATAQELIAENVPWIFVAEPGVQLATQSYVTDVGVDIAYLNYQTFKAS